MNAPELLFISPVRAWFEAAKLEAEKKSAYERATYEYEKAKEFKETMLKKIQGTGRTIRERFLDINGQVVLLRWNAATERTEATLIEIEKSSAPA
jgi:hypothetical protein